MNIIGIWAGEGEFLMNWYLNKMSKMIGVSQARGRKSILRWTVYAKTTAEEGDTLEGNMQCGWMLGNGGDWHNMRWKVKVLSTSLGPHGLYSPWNSPGQNTGMGSLSLLQEIFPTQRLNPVLHCRWILYQLGYHRSPIIWDRHEQDHLRIYWPG